MIFAIWRMSKYENITLEGSFSDVPKRIFATKFSFCSMFLRSTRCALFCTAPESKCSQNVTLFSPSVLQIVYTFCCIWSSVDRVFSHKIIFYILYNIFSQNYIIGILFSQKVMFSYILIIRFSMIFFKFFFWRPALQSFVSPNYALPARPAPPHGWAFPLQTSPIIPPTGSETARWKTQLNKIKLAEVRAFLYSDFAQLCRCLIN